MEKVIEKLTKSQSALESKVAYDEFVQASEKVFDCLFDGTSRFYPWEKPLSIPTQFKIGVIVGGSGSGKTQMLKNFGLEEIPEWNKDKAVISHFENPDDGINRLGSVGFNSIPSWYKPFHVLSNGEKFRADLARKLKSGAVIDEFTSVVDRQVAKAASASISKYIKNNDIHNVVLATCHYDVLEWLEPDWVMDLDSGELLEGFFLSGHESRLRSIAQNMIIGTCLATIII